MKISDSNEFVVSGRSLRAAESGITQGPLTDGATISDAPSVSTTPTEAHGVVTTNVDHTTLAHEDDLTGEFALVEPVSDWAQYGDGYIDGTPLMAEPKSALPRQERQAVGRVLKWATHALDFVSIAVPLLLSGPVLKSPIPLKVIVLCSIIGTILLWSTARRGRVVVIPSENLLSIAARVGLAPVVTLILISLVQIERFGEGGQPIASLAILQMVLATIPLILLGRIICFRLVGTARNRGYDLEDTLIVGCGPTGVEVAKVLAENPEFGLVPCGFIDRFDDQDELPVVGRPENLPDILTFTGIKHVVLAFGAAREDELVSIVRRCHHRDVNFYAVPRLFELGVSAEALGYEVDGLPLIPLRRPGVTSQTWPAKRAFDLVAASILLLLTSPIMLSCALMVKLSSRGPVFFRQVRVGLGGQPFEILKFRSMRVNDDSSTQWTVDDDDRVTWIGKILRPTHLDELPQLINVMRGEMSLVGPRPERPHFVEQFSEEIEGYDFRHRVPVGITGWAQVHGYWGDTSIETRVRLDNRYIENWSLWRDLVIGLRTIPTLLGKRKGG